MLSSRLRPFCHPERFPFVIPSAALFIPSVDGDSIKDAGSFGNYWTANLSEYMSDRANFSYFSDGGPFGGYYSRFYGYSVRPVSE